MLGITPTRTVVAPNLISNLFERVFAVVALALVNRIITGADGLLDLKGLNSRIGK